MSKEAMKLALEKVQEFKARWWKVPPFGNKVNKATREAISNAHSPIFELEHTLCQALAEQPAQQQEPWVGLTDEEMREIYKRTDWDMAGGWEYERAIEAKLKEKNT